MGLIFVFTDVLPVDNIVWYYVLCRRPTAYARSNYLLNLSFTLTAFPFLLNSRRSFESFLSLDAFFVTMSTFALATCLSESYCNRHRIREPNNSNSRSRNRTTNTERHYHDYAMVFSKLRVVQVAI